ncbi:MAG: SET domain-containing protein-lysine N-methyltransferase [Rhodothermales bacterium]
MEIAPLFLLKGLTGMLPPSIELRVYDWESLTGADTGKAIVLGYGSLYNHSDNPNLSYSPDAANDLMTYTARRPIAAHEQLTIHYDRANGQHTEEQEGWFARNAIEKRAIA